ncbi:MAG: hypothetical protein GY861_15395, partial [bacterium]|nr:hypothetical protein [bacterium]
AIDINSANITGLQAGSADIRNSAWTTATFTEQMNNPIIAVTQNDDDGPQDPQYPWARSITNTGFDFRYCEQDGNDDCDTHNTEIVVWIAIEQGVMSLGKEIEVLAEMSVMLVDEIVTDFDGDGVTDTQDSCLATPAGEVVDVSGCSCSQKTCDDSNPCTDDSCDDLTAQCDFVNNDANSCDDLLYCTINDRCSSGSCISDTMNCSDSFECTSDSCDETYDLCINIPDDGLCTSPEVCNPFMFNTPSGCGIVTECTGRIDGASCDDGLYCMINESCQAGVCTGAELRNCSDLFSCTTDTCDEASSQCINTADDSLCASPQICDPLQFPEPSGCGYISVTPASNG